MKVTLARHSQNNLGIIGAGFWGIMRSNLVKIPK